VLRIFVSFYLFIVIALVGLSALLENLILDTEPEQAYIELLALSLKQYHHKPISQENLQALNQHPDMQANTLDSAEMAFPEEQLKSLESRGYLITYSDDGLSYIYINVAQERLLQVSIATEQKGAELFLWYRIAFFSALALMVALWSWPIWRDIKRLEQAARSVQADGSIKPITVGTSTSLNVVAQALASLSEQVRSLLNNQRELTSAVAHEFRTPLARLKFGMESITEPELKHTLTEDLVELEQLTQEMLEFSQSEHHQPELAIAEIPVAELVSATIESIPVVKTQYIELDYQCKPMMLQADGHFMQRALLNLINNGLKYAEGKVFVSTEEGPDAICISVDDDGPGVPEDLREKVFDAFYRPDKGRARHQGGAGLGLATVKRIQQWHHGSCWVEDSPLGGARFVLSYPK